MFVNKNVFVFCFVTLFSWALLTTGVIIHLDNFVLFAYFILLFTSVFFIVYITYPHKNGFQDSVESKKSHVIYSLFFIACFGFFALKVSYLLFLNDFNLQYVRNTFFSESGKSQVYGSNKYISMIYNYVIVAFFWGYIFTRSKFSKLDFIAMFMFFISGVVTGGRFNGYKLLIFAVLLLLITPKLKSEIKFKTFFYFITVLILLLGVSFNRVMLTHDLNVLDAASQVFQSIYNYHSVQVGIFLEFEKDNQEYFGPLMGVFTPIYTLLGMTSPEGNAGTALSKVSFTENGYNAFGTSAVFFSYLGESAFLAFFTFVALVYLLISKIRLARLRTNLYLFMCFSLFFSAFQPYMFGFSWWVTVVVILFFYFGNPKYKT